MAGVEPLEEQPKGSKGKKKEEEPEELEEAEYTKKDIKKMDNDQLSELADEQGLDPDDYETWEDLADAIIDELAL